MAAEDGSKRKKRTEKNGRETEDYGLTKEEESAKDPLELLTLLIVITFTERKRRYCKFVFFFF